MSKESDARSCKAKLDSCKSTCLYGDTGSSQSSSSDGFSTGTLVLGAIALIVIAIKFVFPMIDGKASVTELLNMKKELEILYSVNDSDLQEVKDYKLVRLARETMGIDMMIADRSVRISKQDMATEKSEIAKRLEEVRTESAAKKASEDEVATMKKVRKPRAPKT